MMRSGDNIVVVQRNSNKTFSGMVMLDLATLVESIEAQKDDQNLIAHSPIVSPQSPQRTQKR